MKNDYNAFWEGGGFRIRNDKNPANSYHFARYDTVPFRVKSESTLPTTL